MNSENPRCPITGKNAMSSPRYLGMAENIADTPEEYDLIEDRCPEAILDAVKESVKRCENEDRSFELDDFCKAIEAVCSSDEELNILLIREENPFCNGGESIFVMNFAPPTSEDYC